ncbi:Ig-like domain-containing protein [Alteromonas antoniana]|uniref:Ig-like domain-containing protein n=1 Tax=Alteromonas antoniana TaxID=2803813 RepID=UPI003083FDC1
MMRKLLLLSVVSLALTGCFDDDDDDKEKPVMNTAPEAISETFITQTDTPFSDMLSASDADGDMLTYALDTEAMLGTVEVMDDGSFTYTPNAQVTGEDSFVFTVSDGKASATGTVTVTIEVLEVSVSEFTRDAFAQDPTDAPLPVNGREFIQDAEDPDAFDDLLIDQ